MSRFRKGFLVLALLLGAEVADAQQIGRPATPEEIAAWDRDVGPDGAGLPSGSGDVATGEEIFTEKCAFCHGDFGEGIGAKPALAGGFGTLTQERTVRTVGSYWPYLSTAYDFIRRAKPFGASGSLSDDDVYALVAYILYLNDLVEDDFVLSDENFGAIELPNAQGFYADDRPETEYPAFSTPPCMTACKDAVRITMHASALDVTPAEAAAQEEPAPDTTPDPALTEAGAAVFRKCQSCHQVGEGAKNRTGPVLNGVVGRLAASVSGFRYSSAMTEKGAEGLIWSADALDHFFTDPRAAVPGTKMSFRGLARSEDRAAIIAYLSGFPAQ